MDLNTRWLALLVLSGATLVGHALAGDPASPDVKRDLVFTEVEGQRLMLDLYLPPVDGRPPLVVWIHGGGWRGGSRKNPKILDITEHGYALASISYRLTDKAIFPPISPE